MNRKYLNTYLYLPELPSHCCPVHNKIQLHLESRTEPTGQTLPSQHVPLIEWPGTTASNKRRFCNYYLFIVG